MNDSIKNLDRIQKRAKGWARKWYTSDEDPSGDKLIEKLRALLETEVKPLAAKVMSYGQGRLVTYTGRRNRLYDSAQNYIGVLSSLVFLDLPQAINDPLAYAEDSNITYVGEGTPENIVEHLVMLAEEVFNAARSVESTVTVLRRKNNPLIDAQDPAVAALNRYISSSRDNELFYNEPHLRHLVQLAHGELRDVLHVPQGTRIYRGISVYADDFESSLRYFTDGDPSTCGVSTEKKYVEHTGSWDALASSWSPDLAVAKEFAEETEGSILLSASAPAASFGGPKMAKALARTGESLGESEVIVVGGLTVDGVAWCPPDNWGTPEWDEVVQRVEDDEDFASRPGPGRHINGAMGSPASKLKAKLLR